MPSAHPIGIDLGTTFSAAAWVDPSGHTAMIRNAEGDLLTPSVVLFTDQEVAVGKEARTATAVHPELVAEWVKRDMGLPYYTRPIHGRKLPPEVIQACILRKLKADILRALGQMDRVVITVPAYFDEPRRHRTADAGEMAGLKVLDIVNEPTAAALSFGEMLGYLTPGAVGKEEMTLFVYDLGGGTFDATVLRLTPGNIHTIATDGDVQLGGHDWDLRMADYVADQFQKAQGIDPRQDPAAMNRVLAAVIDAKHTLSARSRATVRVDLLGRSMEIPVTREQFHEMTADLLERTAYTTRQLLAAAKMDWKDISRLLLVGGSTRMPMVVDMLRQLSGIEPDHTVNPDEAVARGAALYAAFLLAREGGGARADFTITNVNSHSLGVEGIDPDTLRKTNVVLIPRNTSLPAKVTERFATKSENQRSIVLQVLEGESSLPGECTAIGRTVIHGLPEGLPKNWPVEVTFEYGASGRLTVQAVVPGTDQGATLNLERAVGMSNDGIARWKTTIDAAPGFKAFESMVEEALDWSPEPVESSPVGQPPSAVVSDSAQPRVVVLPPETTPRTQAAANADAFDAMVQDVMDSPDAAVEPPSRSDVGQPPPAVVSDSAQPRAAVLHPPSPEVAPPPVVAPAAGGDSATEAAASGQSASPPRKVRVARWITVIGHVIAALIGLGLGYWAIHYFRPDIKLPWWNP